MPKYYYDYDERYPDYDLYDKEEPWIRKTVELTEQEAKCFTAAKILYNYWQNYLEKKIDEQNKGD